MPRVESRGVKRLALWLIGLSLVGCQGSAGPTAPATPAGTPAAASTPAGEATPGQSPTSPVAQVTTAVPAQALVFAGDTYYLADAKSSKTQAIREFLLDGETFDDYSKLLAVRRQSGHDLRAFEKSYLEQVEQRFPGSPQQVFLRTKDRLTRSFLFADAGGDREYNLWHWRATSKGILSLQFVLRNQGPYKDPARFQAAIKKYELSWREDLDRLAPEIDNILEGSGRDED